MQRRLIEAMHIRFSHASAGELKRIPKLNLNGFEEIRAADVDHWYQECGRFCSGCAEGKVKEHARIKPSKPLQSNNPGCVTVGNMMFIEGAKNVKRPLLIHVNICTKYMLGKILKDRSEEECTKAILQVKEVYARNDYELKQLVFVRDPGIVPIEDKLLMNGFELKLKVAGQKVGLAEVSIRLVREKARATKAGVRAKFNYLPPNQFNVDLCLDSISVLNRILKQENDKTPYELFTGNQTDYMRDLRVEWGEPVVKKPKEIVSYLKVTGQWGVVVRCMMKGTGVLKVYLVQSKRFAYRLHFMPAVAPEWVLESLKELNPDMSIGFEADSENYEVEISEVIAEDGNKHDYTYKSAEEEVEVEIIGGSDHAQVVMQSVKSVEDAWHDMAIKQEKVKVETLQEPEIEEEGKVKAEIQTGPGLYVTRSGRVSCPTSRLIETAYALIRETYRENFSESGNNITKEIVECTYSMQKALLFQNAMKSRPDEAMKALREEVIKAMKINIWHPVHKDLSEEERKLVILQMINYFEKYKPDATFDKFKVRVGKR
jgi:hypothetical protein